MTVERILTETAKAIHLVTSQPVTAKTRDVKEIIWEK